jgi:hypothetical protein
MSAISVDAMARLSALRLVSFIPANRDAVHVGMLTPDATRVVDLSTLGIEDAHDGLAQLPLLRRTAGAIIHGGVHQALDVRTVHMVAPIPLARCVVHTGDASAPIFADPTTLHGPGSALSRGDAQTARAGLATVVGETLAARTPVDDNALDAALIGTTLVLGWVRTGPDGNPQLLPGAIGPFVAVPMRQPESVICTLVAPIPVAPSISASNADSEHAESANVASPNAGASLADHKHQMPAPGADAFRRLARAALASHTLHAGDLLTIFPAGADAGSGAADAFAPTPGSWIRVSAPGLGTLSLAVS